MKKVTLLFFSFVFIFLPSISLAKIDDSNINSIVQIKIWDTYRSEYISTGSGVFIDDTNNVLTNYHVAEDAIINPKRYIPIVCITKNSLSFSDCKYIFSAYGMFGNGKSQATEELDLAVLTLAGMIKDNKTVSIWHMTGTDLPLGSTNIKISIYGEELTGIKAGDQIQVLGYPAEGGDTITYSSGAVTNFIVNADSRVLAIVTSARMTPGSSGGAAFDSSGKFIGVPSAMYTDSNGNFISGVIIPVTTVNWWLKEVQGYRIKKDGEYTNSVLSDEVMEAALCLMGGGSNCVSSGVGGGNINTSTGATIVDGDIIQNPNAAGDAKFDIYIVKLVGAKKFKRLVLNPQVFASYGHLKWENIKKISMEEMISYKTSALVKVEGDPKVMALMPNGDAGSKSWLNVPAETFIAAGGDWDSVYQINTVDGANYTTGTKLTTQAQFITFLTAGILP